VESAHKENAALRARVEELTLERDRLNRLAGALTAQIEQAKAETARLEQENDRLRRDRAEALNVRSRDGLLSSEWVARTGRAEAIAKQMQAKLAAVVEALADASDAMACEELVSGREACGHCAACRTRAALAAAVREQQILPDGRTILEREADLAAREPPTQEKLPLRHEFVSHAKASEVRAEPDCETKHLCHAPGCDQTREAHQPTPEKPEDRR
jgi:hypothetical protein